jgi:GNAT superfamily N-acetyltransferase
VAVAVADVDERQTVLGTVTYALPGSRWAELCRPGEAEFRMLGVAPAARGRGVGAALVDWCIDRARSAGLTRLVICSKDSMRAAHQIYQRRGFVRRPELDWSPVPDVQLIGFTLDLR